MRDIALPLLDFLQSLDSDAASAYQVRRVHAAFAQAVFDVYGPVAVKLILSHVQAVYVMKDDGTYVGDAKPPILLRIYTSDPTVRADLDARQEFIKMSLARQGIQVDKVKLHASTFGMKERAPFEGILQRLEKGEPLFDQTASGNAYREASEQDMIKLLQVLKTALCQVFREDADAVVKGINAAYVKPSGKKKYRVAVYTTDKTLQDALSGAAEACSAHMRDLGVPVSCFDVHSAEPWMRGSRAFPALSAPIVVVKPN